MATFDFISGEDFRLSLEADYRELNLAMEAKAWKAVHVLGGSIIEAVLIDYLIASEYQKRSSSDPLRMSLAEAITTCKQEGVLSEITEHLSHAIREYRNLIHPGRSVRNNQKVSENGAKIAQALVEIIVDEVSTRRRQNYGFTAEQIITKLEHDPTAIGIIGHLLKDTNESEKERLLLDVIPTKYLDLMDSTDEGNLYDLLSSLETSFRLAFEAVSEEIKGKVTKHFVRVIREESSSVGWRYAFFRGADLQYLSFEEASLIKQHFLSILKHPISDSLLQAMEGIGKFLTVQEAKKFIYPFINTVFIYGGSYAEKAIRAFASECLGMETAQLETVEETLRNEYTEAIKSGKDKVARAEKKLYEAVFFQDLDDIINNTKYSLGMEEFP